MLEECDFLARSLTQRVFSHHHRAGGWNVSFPHHNRARICLSYWGVPAQVPFRTAFAWLIHGRFTRFYRWESCGILCL